MRIDRIGDHPMSDVPVSVRGASNPVVRDIATRLVASALICALAFLAVRIAMQF